MATEKEFDEYVGKIMRICQGVEHDIKLIYCGMCEDADGADFEAVYKSVSKTTLGQTLKELYEIDHRYTKPYFSESDYRILQEITDIRNHWAHQGYVDWMYDKSSFSFQQKWERLVKDYKRIEPLGRQTENIRLEFFGIDTEED